MTKPTESPSVLPADPAGPADPPSRVALRRGKPGFRASRFGGQARVRAPRFGEARKVLEKRRRLERVSHKDPQAIIIVGSVTSWLAKSMSTMREWNRTETLSGATVRRTALPLTFSVHFLLRLSI